MLCFGTELIKKRGTDARNKNNQWKKRKYAIETVKESTKAGKTEKIKCKKREKL